MVLVAVAVVVVVIVSVVVMEISDKHSILAAMYSVNMNDLLTYFISLWL